MKRGYGLLSLLVVTLTSGCIDFADTRRVFCETVSPETRAEVCLDGPQVVTLAPGQGASGVDTATRITVTFNVNVTCPSTGIALRRDDVTVPGTTACSPNSPQAIFTPSTALLNLRTHRATINPTIKDDRGIPALSTSWTFTTR